MPQYKGVNEPHPSTLAKYGLSLAYWKKMVRQQDSRCAICRRDNVRLVIDHEHAPGWKHMPAEKRRKYVRGLLCDRENHWIVGKYATVELLRLSADYLERYERKKSESTEQ